MKKILFLSLLLVTALLHQAMAQVRAITGRVTDAATSQPLPGVTVLVKGTNTGTATAADGSYSINVPEGGNTLVFRFIGYDVVERAIGSAETINVEMGTASQQLSEVVVTGAYGTTRTARSTANNAQVVNAEQLNVIRQPSVNNALAGKVAGVQVRSQSAAALGRQSEVRLRGTSGFGLGSGALYIVDGTILPNAEDINMDDIESVTVLQGPAAAAQFGSQAANGAIVMTLKKGRKQPGVGVTLNMGAMFEKAYIMPNYQNSYAGGAFSDLVKYNWKDGDPEEWKALDGKYYHDYSDDASWGPRMVGQEYIPWYAWYGGHSRSYQTAKLNPQPDNARDYFNTGVSLNNSVTLSTGTDNLAFKLTYGNQDVKGLIPNSSLNKNTLNIKTSYELNKHFEASANINYVNTKLKGEIDDAYSNQTTGSFSQWFHRNLDMGIMKELRGLTTPDGIYASWNKANPGSYDPANERAFYAGNYWYNFYTYYDLVDQVNQRDRLFGDIALTYKVNDDLRFTATYRKQQNTVFGESKYSSQLALSGLQTTGNNPFARGYYGTSNSYSNRRNIEFVGSYTKQIGDFSLEANAGADFFRWVNKYNGASTNQGLNVPDLFTISNSVNEPSILNDRIEEAYNAAFVKSTFGWKNLLFAEVTLRNDWFSTLPAEDNDVLSKSFGASFVFSDLISDSYEWISYGKLRGSWGEVPKALGATNETFGAYVYPGFAYSVGQFKWGNNFLMSTPNQLVDPNIKGSVVSMGEIGLDMSFLQNRFGFQFTYFEGAEKDFPYPLVTNGASGYTSLYTNIGEISKKGIELQVNGMPINSDKFTWDITGTWANLIENDIVELAPGVTQTPGIQGVWGTTMPYLVHTEGERWGQLVGNGIKRIDGKPVLNDDGSYVNDPNVNFGSVLPQHTGGVQNSFTLFRDFTINANIDYQVGGKFVSLSNMWGSYSGLTARTARTNEKGNPIRDAVADGGGVHVVGVNEEGQDVDYWVEAQDYYHGLYGSLAFDEFVYDLTFVKLRELSVGYRIPVDKLNLGNVIQNAHFSIVSRNPVLIYAKTKDFDPSEVSAVAGETGQLPGTRGLGFNLRIQF
ncbi:SusC/RagA family TonB-linked outer membrane protein [Pontibacter litorisediminis]|uniref:SusC/RagA family TonB-linked outer membrane protein n=1 Tax=Pontibacter litorisediminis TaxID=1846260 RepID=UPI0023ED4CAB|nr:SusC/RagA family TonB-linked outer membrane protein [Pontibacter litorisediminis]